MKNLNDLLGVLSTTVLIAITTVVLLIWYSIWKQRYWKVRGVPYIKPIPLIGNILDQLFKVRHQVEAERYFKYGPIYGYFEGNTPLLSVADLKLLRNIYVKDFQYFSMRRKIVTGHEVRDKILLSLEGEDWKRVRSIITPTFSSGKLKRLLNIFKECANTLVQNMKTSAEKGEPINAKSLYGALSMDVIASSAFSTKLDSHNDPQNKFVQSARKGFEVKVNWRLIVAIFFPNFIRFVGKNLNNEAINFFCDLTFQIIEERKRTGQTRNDFLQLLLDTAKETANEEKWEETDADTLSNYCDEAENQKDDKNVPKKSLTMEELVAQCVIFFLAGYETTGSTLSLATYSLAINQDVQETLRQEITECLKETNGELTYEALQKMKYLDNVISETLRMYPPLGRLEKTTQFDYKLGDTGITVPKGMLISIPVYALHTDPKIYPNPEKFDPNRFTAEERAKRDPYAYTPFGAGPRICIGMRFALLEIKTTLVYVLSHFNIKTCPQTQIPIELNVGGLGLLQPKAILLEMEPRENTLLVK